MSSSPGSVGLAREGALVLKSFGGRFARAHAERLDCHWYNRVCSRQLSSVERGGCLVFCSVMLLSSCRVCSTDMYTIAHRGYSCAAAVAVTLYEFGTSAAASWVAGRAGGRKHVETPECSNTNNAISNISAAIAKNNIDNTTTTNNNNHGDVFLLTKPFRQR